MEHLIKKMDEAALLKKDYSKLMIEYIASFIVGLLLFVVGCGFCYARDVHGFKMFVVLSVTALPACWYGSYIPFVFRNIQRIGKAIALTSQFIVSTTEK